MAFLALINFCFVISFIFTSEALPHRAYSAQSSALHIQEFTIAICCENLLQEFAMAICCENLPQEFAVGICCKNLLWLFASRICHGYLPFVFVSNSFFVYVSKSCLYESKPFLHVGKTFLFVRFSSLTVFLFVIAVAVMGHHII